MEDEKRSRSAMTDEEKRARLFLDQASTLDSFLERGAITAAQYEKSMTALKKAFPGIRRDR